MRIPYASAIVPSLLTLSTLLAGCVDSQTGYNPDEEYYPGPKAGTLYVGVADDGGIYAYDVEEKEMRRLVSGSEPALAPDGALLCRHDAGLVEYAPESGSYRIIVARDPNTAADRTWATNDDEFHAPQVSRDGRYVAYEGNMREIYVVDRASGDLLATLDSPDWGIGYSHPSWTPENRLVVAGSEANPGLWISDASWESVTPIASDLFDAGTPAVSPDGTTILFSYRSQLYTIGIDGENLEPSFDAPGVSPCWSPDGTYYAFAIGNSDDFRAVNACFYNPTYRIMVEPFMELDEGQWFSEMSTQMALR